LDKHLETNILQKALNTLELPPFITKEDIKRQYKYLAKKYHPDIYKDSSKMAEINEAYSLLMEYIDNFRYSFDDDELNKQAPELKHHAKFRF